MKKIIFGSLLCAIFSLNATIRNANYDQSISKLHQRADTDWLIVGAGPAGIAVLGVLLDIGVDPQNIVWLDPEFNVGRLGVYYANVPANNNNYGFVTFITACNSFCECKEALNYINSFDPKEFQTLRILIEALQMITHTLRPRVRSIQSTMTSLYFKDDLWHVETSNQESVSAINVILATGSKPRILEYEKEKIIPLDLALDPEYLKNCACDKDVIGVVGSSHSAILLLKFLSEMPIQHLYNLYKHPLVYAVDMGDYVLNSYTGLKGVAAKWAQEVLEVNPPRNLTRIFSTEKALQAILPQCSKVIYAVGYEPNNLPAINGTTPIVDYDNTTGYIAPRLFGIGIAFPEKTSNQAGQSGSCIGINCFMSYAQKMIPQWANNEAITRAENQMCVFNEMDELFSIWPF